MENYLYKNRVIEIFTAKVEEKWTSVFMVDGKMIDAIRGPAFDSREAAAEAAKAEAQSLIDSDTESIHLNAFVDSEIGKNWKIVSK